MEESLIPLGIYFFRNSQIQAYSGLHFLNLVLQQTTKNLIFMWGFFFNDFISYIVYRNWKKNQFIIV